MTITITHKEYEAIQFAISQVETDLEAATNEQYCEDTNECLNALYRVIEKYHKARYKTNYFQSVRAEVSRRNRNMRPRDIDKLTRRLIKKLNENQ